jgi:hypothetical protein
VFPVLIAANQKVLLICTTENRTNIFGCGLATLKEKAREGGMRIEIHTYICISAEPFLSLLHT